MKITEIKTRNSQLIEQLLNVWEDSVRETHLFLSDVEIKHIKKYVPQALLKIKHLIVAKNEIDCPVAFMGIENQKLEMLFISPDERNKGLGKALIQKGINDYFIKEVTVNEQNLQAIGFYKHLGFKVYKRTDHDEQGAPYPLLYMKND